MRKLLRLSLLAISFGLAGPGFAQDVQEMQILSQPSPDSPLGARNPNAAKELDQFAFVIGDWDADVVFVRPDGSVLNFKGKWHNIWVDDGLAVFQEWRGPFTTGMEFRTWRPQEGRWAGQNYYPGPRGWWPTWSDWNEETGEMTVHSTKPTPEGDQLNEEIYYDITRDGFKMRSRMSADGGTTWTQGAFSLTATRSE